MFKRFLLSIGIISFIFILLFISFKGKKDEGIVSPIGKNTVPEQKTVKEKILEIFENRSKLETQLKEMLKAKDGTYAVYSKNLKSGELVQINTNLRFGSGSLYKLWVMSEAYRQIKEGILNKDDAIAIKRGELYDEFDLDVADENRDEDLSTTVDNAIEQMIIISDNDSALLLSHRLGINNITDFLKNNGFNSSTMENPPETTAHDIGLFYEKLYEGEIVDKSASEEMLALLKRQRLNDRIPKYLPEDTVVAHKTGELDTFKHDAGIIFGKDPYILVVLTDTEDPQAAAENTATLSKAIYGHFENEKP